MFNWLYAGRIGLGWAHNAISFACHMYMHFPCICTSFQYSYYIELFWSFSNCLFLSLPLLLVTLVMSMTPKCKSTLAWNPFHSSASSSSDHASLSLHFHNDDAHKTFTKKISWRGIHSKRQVILGHFANTDLPTIIHSQEWESLCDKLITCPLMLI